VFFYSFDKKKIPGVLARMGINCYSIFIAVVIQLQGKKANCRNITTFDAPDSNFLQVME